MVFSIQLRGGRSVNRMIVKLNRIKTDLPVAGSEGMLQYAQLLKKTMKQIIQTESQYSKTGRLANSFEIQPPTIQKTGKASYTIVNHATAVNDGYEYAGVVDMGARKEYKQPNSIIPKFRTQGHPRTKPMHFRARAIGRTKEQFRAIMAQKIQNTLRRTLK